MTGNSKGFLILIACGGLFFGALFCFIGWRLWREGRELRSAGVTANAKVLKKFRKVQDRSWGGLENYYVLCAFSDEAGVPREVEIKLPSKLWRQLREGGTQTITYLPGQLETARAGPRWGWKIRGGIGTVMMLFGVVVLIVFPLGTLRELLSSTVLLLMHLGRN